MNPKTLSKAIQCAEIFLAEAKSVAATECPGSFDSSLTWLKAGPKETGSLRRRSMDLTRALAELRKP